MITAIELVSASDRPHFCRSLRAIDAFAATNTDSFRDAFGILGGMVCEPNREHFRNLLSTYLAALRSGEFPEGSPMEQMPLVCLMPILTAYFHLTAGTPIHIDDSLLAMWAVSPDGGVAQCMTCGYRFPAPFPKCSLCGGQIGEPGAWERKRAARVGMN
jgi:hypothetical protein